MTAPAAGGATELDLGAPGKFKCKVENQDTTTFYVVVPQAHYTKDALSKNPQVNPADQLMAPFAVPANQCDKDGFAWLDLAGSGRIKELIQKVTERIDKGQKPENVRAIAIATARQGNCVPPQQLAEVKDLKLIAIPTIKLTPAANTAGKTFITVQQYKAGTKNFMVELQVTGPITEVALTTDPATHIKATPGGEGQGRFHLKVKEGQKYQIAIPAPFKVKQEEQGKVRALINCHPPYFHRNPLGQPWEVIKPHHANGESRCIQVVVSGNWPSCCFGYCYTTNTHTRRGSGHCHFCHSAMAQSEKGAAKKREIWEGGMVTLRAAGTGKFAHIVQNVALKAESWASDWLNSIPPAPLIHGAC